jgi:hypothetical protein
MGSHISAIEDPLDPMATAPKFRIDVDIHNLLMDSSREPIKPAAANGLTLTEPVFPTPSQILEREGEMQKTSEKWLSLSIFTKLKRRIHERRR